MGAIAPVPQSLAEFPYFSALAWPELAGSAPWSLEKGGAFPVK
jgi:hypothetical protein